MPFKHACFLSYRHAEGNKLASRIIDDLYDALNFEIELHLGKDKVYRDRYGLQPGDLLDEKLAKDLCESVCMVVVYTPSYFDREYLYCAREFRAMERLEEARLSLLTAQDEEKRGLIIILVLRGEERLPESIRSKRLYHKFDDFLLSDARIYKNPRYARLIRQIADYIAQRFREFEELSQSPERPPDPCIGCAQYRLPSDEEIKVWLDGLTGAQRFKTPFVMREA